MTCGVLFQFSIQCQTQVENAMMKKKHDEKKKHFAFGCVNISSLVSLSNHSYSPLNIIHQIAFKLLNFSRIFDLHIVNLYGRFNT